MHAWHPPLVCKTSILVLTIQAVALGRAPSTSLLGLLHAWSNQVTQLRWREGAGGRRRSSGISGDLDFHYVHCLQLNAWMAPAIRPLLLRRRGVAQALVAACEAVALAAGFPDLYIQAATTARDPSSPLGGWLSQARNTDLHLIAGPCMYVHVLQPVAFSQPECCGWPKLGALPLTALYASPCFSCSPAPASWHAHILSSRLETDTAS